MDNPTNLISSINVLINNFINNFWITFTVVIMVIFLFWIFIYLKYFKTKQNIKDLNIQNSVINTWNNVNILNSNK